MIMKIIPFNYFDGSAFELVIYERPGGGVIIDINNSSGRCVGQQMLGANDNEKPICQSGNVIKLFEGD